MKLIAFSFTLRSTLIGTTSRVATLLVDKYLYCICFILTQNKRYIKKKVGSISLFPSPSASSPLILLFFSNTVILISAFFLLSSNWYIFCLSFLAVKISVFGQMCVYLCVCIFHNYNKLQILSLRYF